MTELNWSVYMLTCCNNKRTYIGASNNPERRLRCHNGELSGGAKCTKMFRPWKHIFIIEKLNKIQALQLEWRLKKWTSKKTGKIVNCPGIKNRTNNLFTVLNLDKWTSKSSESKNIQLHIKFYNSINNINITNNIEKLPGHITHEYINILH